MLIFEAMKLFPEKAFPFHLEKGAVHAKDVVPSHIHDVVELVYIVEGNAIHDLGGLTYQFSPGDLFIIEPSTYHGYIGSKDSDTIMYTMLFDQQFLHNELFAIFDVSTMNEATYFMPFMRSNWTFHPYLSVPADERAYVAAQLETMLQELQKKEMGFKLVIKTRLIECLIQFSRFYQIQPSRLGAARETNEQWFHTIKSFLEAHYNHLVSLEQLSRLCGMSISSMTTKFKAASGKTLIEYKHDIQIREACKLLLNRDYKVADIALEVGFKDLSFFYQVFHKRKGMTPAGYQNQVVK